MCACTFQLDKCADATRHTQIAIQDKTVFPARCKALLYCTRVVCIDSSMIRCCTRKQIARVALLLTSKLPSKGTGSNPEQVGGNDNAFWEEAHSKGIM